MYIYIYVYAYIYIYMYIIISRRVVRPQDVRLGLHARAQQLHGLGQVIKLITITKVIVIIIIILILIIVIIIIVITIIIIIVITIVIVIVIVIVKAPRPRAGCRGSAASRPGLQPWRACSGCPAPEEGGSDNYFELV